MNKFEYTTVFSRLSYETAEVIFIKKDGTVRVMLATRNLRTAELLYGFLGGKLSGHDKRCSITNGNIAVIDLELGESRSFSIDRVVDICFLGEIKDIEALSSAVEQFKKFKATYENQYIENLSLDTL